MRKFQYGQVHITEGLYTLRVSFNGEHFECDSHIDILNHLGQFGWKLVDSHYPREFVMMREIESPLIPDMKAFD